MPRQKEAASTRTSEAVPVSGAALVPCLAASVHAVSAWLAPDHASTLSPLLPLFVELLLFWLPVVSLCLWFARWVPARGRHSASERVADALVSTIALAALAYYLVKVRLPTREAEWTPEQLVTELHALLSATTHGVPLVALGALLGWAALVTIMARAFGQLASRAPGLAPHARALRALAGSLLFAVGSSAVLRYATGSPWPLIG